MNEVADINVSENENKNSICTICKDCCWAIYDNDTQTGCALGRIDQFQKNGVEIVEAQDGDKEFFIIPDKICLSHRTKEWAEKNKNNLVNLFDKIELEMAVKIDMVIYFDEYSTLDNLIITLDSIKKQTFQPFSVRIILNNSKTKLALLVALLQQNYKELSWSVDHVNPENSYEEMLNLSVRNCKGFLVLFIDNGTIFDNYDRLFQINNYINKELKQFIMIKHKFITTTRDFNGVVIHRQLYNMLGGNSKKTIIEKIKEVSIETNMEHMIIDWSDLNEE